MHVNRDILLVIGGRFGVALLTFVSIRAVTTLLTPEQYGALALLIAVQMFCGLFLLNPVGQHISIHTHAWWNDGTLLARLRSFTGYVLFVSLVGGIASLTLAWHQSWFQMALTFLAVLAVVLTSTWNTVLIPMLNMLGFRADSVVLQIVTAGLTLLFSVLFVLVEPTALAWLLGQSTGMLIGAMGARKALLRQERPQSILSHKFAILDRQAIFGYCLPLAMATGLMWLQQSGYRFIVEHYWGMAQLSFLVVGLQLASQLSLLAESLTTQFFYPMFYRRCSDHISADAVASAYSDLINTLFPVYLLIAVLIAATSQYILYLIAAPQYHDSAAFVMVGAGIELCRLVGNLLSNAAHVTRKSISLAAPYGAGAVTALAILVVAGKTQANFIWVGYALIAGAVAMLVTMWVTVAGLVKVRPDWLRALGTAVAAALLYLFTYYSPNTIDILSSVTWVVLNGVLVLATILALLWKNPATMRLLNVQLGNN